MKKIFLLILFIIIIFSNTAKADTSVEQITNVNIIRNTSSAELSWNNPTNLKFSKIIIFRSDILIEDYFSYEAIEAFCTKIYEGQKETFIDSELAPNLPYYYIFFSKNKNDNYSKAFVQKNSAYGKNDSEDNNENEATKSKNSAQNKLAGANSQVVNEVSAHEAGIIFNYNKAINNPQNTKSRQLALFIMVKSPHNLSNQDRHAISYFIDAGTPTTIILGAGERAGVLNSYLSVFDKLPRNIPEWQDIIKIANGRWPDERNIESEEKAADIYFSAIYKRAPNMDNPKDNAAITVIAYGLRPSSRNTESETRAIEIYKSIFKKAPIKANDWDLVRAIAYSGASR